MTKICFVVIICAMLRRVLTALGEIVYPKICVLCKAKLTGGNIDGLICPCCWAKIPKAAPPFCGQCGRTLDKRDIDKIVCSKCLRITSFYEKAYSCLRYEEGARELIHLFKYSGLAELKKPLCRMLIQHAGEYNIPLAKADFLVPVPLHAAKMREREYNQTLLLAEGLSRAFDVKTFTGLRRRKYTRPQIEVAAAERFENVKGCFTVKNAEIIKDKTVFLIDDIMTTQATLQEASRTLRDAGCAQINVYTLAS